MKASMVNDTIGSIGVFRSRVSSSVAVISGETVCFGVKASPIVSLEYPDCVEQVRTEDNSYSFYALPDRHNGMERSFLSLTVNDSEKGLTVILSAMHDCDLMLNLADGVIVFYGSCFDGMANGIEMMFDDKDGNRLCVTAKGRCRLNENGTLHVLFGRTELNITSDKPCSEIRDGIYSDKGMNWAAKRLIFEVCADNEIEIADPVAFCAVLTADRLLRSSFGQDEYESLLHMANKLDGIQKYKVLLIACMYLFSVGMRADRHLINACSTVINNRVSAKSICKEEKYYLKRLSDFVFDGLDADTKRKLVLFI